MLNLKKMFITFDFDCSLLIIIKLVIYQFKQLYFIVTHNNKHPEIIINLNICQYLFKVLISNTYSIYCQSL